MDGKSTMALTAALCLLMTASTFTTRATKLSPVPSIGLVVVPGGDVQALARNVGSADAGALNPTHIPTVTRWFVLKNTGRLPLRIVQLQPSCDCASAAFEPPASAPTLLPGGRITVRMTVILAGHEAGDFTSAVFVYVRGWPRNVAMLQIVGQIAAGAPAKTEKSGRT